MGCGAGECGAGMRVQPGRARVPPEERVESVQTCAGKGNVHMTGRAGAGGAWAAPGRPRGGGKCRLRPRLCAAQGERRQRPRAGRARRPATMWALERGSIRVDKIQIGFSRGAGSRCRQAGGHSPQGLSRSRGRARGRIPLPRDAPAMGAGIAEPRRARRRAHNPPPPPSPPPSEPAPHGRAAPRARGRACRIDAPVTPLAGARRGLRAAPLGRARRGARRRRADRLAPRRAAPALPLDAGRHGRCADRGRAGGRRARAVVAAAAAAARRCARCTGCRRHAAAAMQRACSGHPAGVQRTAARRPRPA
jgi:hypothetical protein